MIIDSHAHYTHNSFLNTFRYLTHNDTGYAIEEGGRETILQQMQQSGIPYCIEPGISTDSCQRALELAKAYPGRVFAAMGVHPTRCINEKWKNRKKLAAFSKIPGVIAIGECGLDYHLDREKQHRLLQHLWFLYQLNLACRLKKPVILHVRMAHRDMLRILKWHPARKLGGVVHCFTGNWELAQQYLKLGYHIGIGGTLLQTENRSKDLQEAVQHIPLDRILLETDAPFIHPDCGDDLPKKQLRKIRNTSLILPQVAARIAQLKGISPQAVEDACTANTISLFRLPITP